MDDENNEELKFKIINSQDNENYNSSSEKKLILKRNCIPEGSLYSGIFNLVNMSIGTAVFVVPQIFQKLTFIPGLIFISLSCLLNIWSFNLLIISGVKHDLYSYSLLVKKLYSTKFLVILDVTIIVYLYGVLILYQVVSKYF